MNASVTVPSPSLPNYVLGNFILYALIGATFFIFALIIVFIIYRVRGGSISYRAVFLRKEHGHYFKIGEKKFKSDAESVSFKDKTFMFKNDINTLFQDRNKKRIFIDFHSSEILTFFKEKQPLDTKVADGIIKHSIVAQLFASLNPLGAGKTGYLVFIMGAVMFGVIGFLAGYLEAPAKIVNHYVSTNSTGTPTALTLAFSGLYFKLKGVKDETP